MSRYSYKICVSELNGQPMQMFCSRMRMAPEAKSCYVLWSWGDGTAVMESGSSCCSLDGYSILLQGSMYIPFTAFMSEVLPRLQSALSNLSFSYQAVVGLVTKTINFVTVT